MCSGRSRPVSLITIFQKEWFWHDSAGIGLLPSNSSHLNITMWDLLCCKFRASASCIAPLWHSSRVNHVNNQSCTDDITMLWIKEQRTCKKVRMCKYSHFCHFPYSFLCIPSFSFEISLAMQYCTYLRVQWCDEFKKYIFHGISSHRDPNVGYADWEWRGNTASPCENITEIGLTGLVL